MQLCRVNRIQDMYSGIETYASPLLREEEDTKAKKSQEAQSRPNNYQSSVKISEKAMVKPGTFVVWEKYFKDIVELQASYKFLRGGAMKEVVFQPDETKVAIVTCGGLCPGLNNVVRSLVECLEFGYGVKAIWGIRWGYRGFYEEFPKHWM